jgi:hypothetical protein
MKEAASACADFEFDVEASPELEGEHRLVWRHGL